MTLAHILIKVAAGEHAAMVNFYTQALNPLGITKIRTFPSGMVAFGSQAPEWCVAIGDSNPDPKVHVAFVAPDRAAVDDFYRAALAAGGKDNGAPGARVEIHPNYYAAFVLDPVGNNVEATCMAPGESEKS